MPHEPRLETPDSETPPSGSRRTRPWARSKPGIITLISAAVVVCLVVAGIVIFVTIQQSHKLTAARTAYNTAALAHSKSVKTMQAQQSALQKAQATAKSTSAAWAAALPKLAGIVDDSLLKSAEDQAAALGKLTTDVIGKPSPAILNPSPPPKDASTQQYLSAKTAVEHDTKVVQNFDAKVTSASRTLNSTTTKLESALKTLGTALPAAASKLNQANSAADTATQAQVTSAAAAFANNPTPARAEAVATSVTSLKNANSTELNTPRVYIFTLAGDTPDETGYSSQQVAGTFSGSDFDNSPGINDGEGVIWMKVTVKATSVTVTRCESGTPVDNPQTCNGQGSNGSVYTGTRSGTQAVVSSSTPSGASYPSDPQPASGFAWFTVKFANADLSSAVVSLEFPSNCERQDGSYGTVFTNGPVGNYCIN